MRIQYISSTMIESDFINLFNKSKSIPGQQAQKYNRLMIEGLEANNYDVDVISAIPIDSSCYKKFFYKGKKSRRNNICYYYLPVFNIPGVKNFFQMIGSFIKVLISDKKNKIVICDVLNASVSFGACVAAKIRKIPCVGIITDLPHLMVTGTSTMYTKLVNKNIDFCSHYVLLTEQMNSIINSKDKPYVIIEGLCDKKMENKNHKINSKKICMYAGLLDIRYGVKNMVEAFSKANVDDVELHIYGSGTYTLELQKFIETQKNIKYLGNIMNEQIIEKELEATLLINPRPSNEEFTKYSFPSKNMEYMASGTAVLTTNLPGMPKEYLEYVYIFEDETVEGMASTFRSVLEKDTRDLNEKGMLAKTFVLENKNNIIQVQKLFNMFKEDKKDKIYEL